MPAYPAVRLEIELPGRVHRRLKEGCGDVPIPEMIASFVAMVVGAEAGEPEAIRMLEEIMRAGLLKGAGGQVH